MKNTNNNASVKAASTSKSTRTTSRRMTINKEVKEYLVSSVVRLVNKRKGTWEGSMTELDTEVFTSKAPSTWPKSPALLRVALNRSVKMLRENGLRVVFERKSGSMGGKRVARFEKR